MIWTFISLLFFSGCSNVLSNGAKKDSDEAIFEDIQKSVNSSDWTTALSQFETLSSGYQTRRDVIRAWAGAYAGKCGLDFLSYMNNISGSTLTGTTLFKYIMSGFTTTTVSPSDCDLAQTKLEEISVNPAERTTGENFFMGVLGLVKMGTYLRSLADANQDGATDGTFNSCSTVSLSDSNLNSIITGMGLVVNNASYLTNLGDLSTAINTLTGICGASCSITDATAVAAGDRDMFRDLLKTGPGNPTFAQGIESCVNGTINQCCP